jgi:hypothetical protein
MEIDYVLSMFLCYCRAIDEILYRDQHAPGRILHDQDSAIDHVSALVEQKHLLSRVQA